MPRPSKGWPIMVLLMVVSTKRLPRIHLALAVPSDSIGGAPGCIHILLWTSHSPTQASRTLCAAPGDMASIILAVTSGEGAVFFSSAALREINPAAVHETSAMLRALARREGRCDRVVFM